MKSSLRLFATFLTTVAAIDDGLCRTPIMGTNSWTAFGSGVTAADLIATGKLVVLGISFLDSYITLKLTVEMASVHPFTSL